MALIQIHCFGNLKIELDNQSVDRFDTDKTRALLVYLAIENERPHHRSHLAGLLWSDQPEEQAMHSLRQTLSNLRKALGVLPSSEPLLLTERDNVQLNPQVVWVDVLAFRSELASAYRYHQRSNPRGWLNIRRLTNALSLRKGPFLAHFSLKGGPLFDEWLVLMREALDQQAVEGLTLLSEIYESRGETVPARQAARQIVEIAPWDESAHVQLMRLYCLDGKWGLAQSQYRALRRALNEQLGVEPSKETTALFERIRTSGNKLPDSVLRFPACPTNLPGSASPFIGREAELDAITDRLVDPECRLLTLLGPGGVGKTRLAVEAARQQIGVFNDGVFFIPLAVIQSADQVYESIIDSIGLILADQVDLQTRLFDYLREKHMLLVLDNYEQLAETPEGTRPLAEILTKAPGVILLVTSRQRLFLQEEWVFPLSGLIYPQDAIGEVNASTAMEYDALKLFLQRAQQVQPGFTLDASTQPSVIRICQLLEGLPLGVELAAAAVWEQSCHSIAEKIATNLEGLSSVASNIQPRHRSLWAAFDVSWQLLSPDEQALFPRLAVFRSGFTQQAARQVTQATPELLSALVNQSLLRFNPNERYELHESLRQYALEKLNESGEAEETSRLHSQYYCSLLASQTPLLSGSQQKEALLVIQLEINNARLAWEWATAHRQVDLLLASIDGLSQFFNIRSHFNEGIALFQPTTAMLENSLGEIHDSKREYALAMVLSRMGTLAYYVRQTRLAQDSLERAAAFFTRQGYSDELAYCRITLGGLYLRAKNFQEAQACGQKNLEFYRQSNNPLGECRALYLLGLIANKLGRYPESRQYFSDSLEVGRRLDDRRRLIAPLNMLGDLACAEGNLTEAGRLFTESLEIARDLADLYYQAIIINNLADIHFQNHLNALACSEYEESLAICRKIGDQDGEAIALNNLGEIAVAQSDYQQAVRYSEQALKIARQIGEDWTISVCLNNLGEASRETGEIDRALTYLGEAIRISHEIQAADQTTRFASNAGRCYQLKGSLQEAIDLYQAVLAHPATEHIYRQQSIRQLKEMGVEPTTMVDESILDQVVERLFSPSPA